MNMWLLNTLSIAQKINQDFRYIFQRDNTLKVNRLVISYEK